MAIFSTFAINPISDDHYILDLETERMMLLSTMRMFVMGLVLTTTTTLVLFADALSPSIKPKPTSSSSTTTAKTRRALFHRTLATASAVIGLGGNTLFPQEAVAADDDSINVFLGTYTDPVNHPGGTRTITLSGTGFGNFQLAKITGGGGQGEPVSFELNGLISPCPGNEKATTSGGKWCITIDFSPKGGPSEFTGYYDPVEKGIRFPADGNFWPKQ